MLGHIKDPANRRKKFYAARDELLDKGMITVDSQSEDGEDATVASIRLGRANDAGRRRNFTPIRCEGTNEPRPERCGYASVRSGTLFRLSRFFNSLRGRFVPVRFPRRRYGTVHPSIGGCTRPRPSLRTRTGARERNASRPQRTTPRRARGSTGYRTGGHGSGQ